MANERAPFYNHVAIEKGSRQLRREGKLECLDKVWKGVRECVYVCVCVCVCVRERERERERERDYSWLARGEFFQTRGKFVLVCMCVYVCVRIWSKKQANGVNFSFFILSPILGPHRSEGKQKGVLDIDVWLDDSFHKRLGRKYILPKGWLILNIGIL